MKIHNGQYTHKEILNIINDKFIKTDHTFTKSAKIHRINPLWKTTSLKIKHTIAVQSN